MKRWFLIPLLLLVAMLAFGPQTAWAHPLGNFTVNRYAGLTVSSESLRVDYVVDMAEVPAYQEVQNVIDTDRDGTVSEAENSAYRSVKCADLGKKLSLTVNGNPLALGFDSSALEFPPGAAGLKTLRLSCLLSASLVTVAAPRAIDFRDPNFMGRIGWREMTAAGEGATIAQSDVPTVSISDRLRSYPTDLLTSPPQIDRARFEVQSGGAATNQVPLAAPAGGVLNRSADPFAALITTDALSPPVVIFSLLIAAGLGALHAASPGHGKTIMAAYLVGTRGTPAQALLLGLTVTVTHTIGVLALGFITLIASRYILPESLYPWLSLISGVLVIIMGASLAVNRLRALKPGPGHDHSHDHDHEHEQEHEHAHTDNHSHGHAHAHPSTPAHRDADLAHAVSHLPVGFRESGLSWRGLVGLGLVGGLVPSTSALLVLLASISLGRIAFGLVLVTAFGLGMALVLVGTGVLLVRATRLLAGGRLSVFSLRWMPLASAIVVIGAGLFVSAEALAQMGWWH